MNRAKPIIVVLHALLSVLFLLMAAGLAFGQARGNRDPRGMAGISSPTLRAVSGPHVYYSPKMTQVPRSMTLRRYVPHGRAPGDSAVIRQTVLLTKLDYTIQYSYNPATAEDAHPYWTNDEKFIYFDSNRVSDQTGAAGTSPRADGIFNIFSMFADGSGVTQVFQSSVNAIMPKVSSDGTLLAYVAGGTIDLATNGRDNPITSGFNLYVFNLTNGGQPLSLTQNNTSGFGFTDVIDPTWSPGGTQIAFSGQIGKGSPYHIFTVDIQTGVITRLTGPAAGGVVAVEANETAPAWSPDGSVIAFTSNAAAYGPLGPIQATSLNPKNQAAPGDPYQEDIWVMGPTAFAPNPHRVTNSSSMENGSKPSSNKNPAWSTLRPDPLGIVPSETDPNGYLTTSINLLAFASTRVATDPNNPTQPNDIRSTFDIYFLHCSLAADPNHPGLKTVTTPESIGNAPIKLQTTSPGKTFDPNIPNDPAYNDPTFSFDPNYTSNEDFPTWPQYISSYRIAFQSDRGNNSNLWASTIFDINAPTLLKYDIANNEIVHVARDSSPNISVREVIPGETVRFRVRAVDYETGIESVYLQIKDPSSEPKSSDRTEHKIFYFGPGWLNTGPARVVDCPYELDYQAINPSTYAFRTPGSVSPLYLSHVADPNAFAGALPNFFPGWNEYVAGIDDSNAFSGGANPPDDDAHDYTNQGGFWLQLWDDGPISKGGHEPEGETAGDGVYTASWITPANLPSDWYLDVIVRDNAVDPFDPTVHTNWKIYDNVWGFTTERWQGTNGILYVNDYDCGQRFFQTRAGSFGAGGNLPSAPVGAFLGTPYNGVATESWMTEYDPSIIPSEVVNPVPPPAFALGNFLHTLGAVSYQDSLTNEPGGTDPVTGRYDQWRILARGPVPDAVLNAYRGHIEVTPPDVIAGGTSPLQVFVAERCVIWHSPYVGDLFVGPGTIADAQVQVQLSNFVKNGGRLCLTGQDLTWGLTLGGSQTNAMLSQTFHVNYASDNSNDPQLTPNTADPPVPAGYTAPLSNKGRGDHPIGMEAWYDALHNYPNTAPDDPPANATMYIRTPNTGTPLREYGAPNAVSPDEISFLLPSVLDTSDFDFSYNTTKTPCIVWVTDTSAKPLISKVVYSPLPWEAIQPEFFGTFNLKNRRAELTHNVGDYCRTGRIVGVVQDLNGRAPLKGVFLRAISNHAKDSKGNPVVISTTLTLADGSYILDGLDATGSYTVDAFLPGFITQHGQGGIFHGGYQSKLDFFLSEAKPGSITGKLTDKVTGNPISQVTIRATDNLAKTTFTATTQADGTYSINNVPASKYTVDVPLAAQGGNLDTLGYGSAVTANALYGSPIGAPSYVQVVVGSSQTAQNADFNAIQSPGNIVGLVCDASNNPIAGAVVTATAKIGGLATSSAPTGADGKYSISNLTPGAYTLVAVAPGFKPSPSVPATVLSKQTITVNFCNMNGGVGGLTVAQPGGVSGLVSTSAGLPISGATITVTDANGKVLKTVTTGAVQTAGNYQFNYDTGLSIPSGATVTVTASDPGYTVTTPPANPATVSITEGNESQGVNFLLDPLHTFDHNLSLVSAPYEYSGVANGDVATLLSIPAGDVANGSFAFLTWTNSPPSYISYPTEPAKTFHLGVGYFMQETNQNASLAVTTLGAAANGGSLSQPFNIPLKVGWNLIGEPFPFPLNFLNLKVLQADGTTVDILTAQTGANPTLGAALWSYQNGVYELAYTLDQWKGYWIRVFDNRPSGQQGTPPQIALICDPAARQDRAAATDARQVLVNGNVTGQGWKLGINASAGGKNAAPGYLGMMKGATDNYDRFKLEAPPAVGGKNVKLAFEHTDWANKSGSYSVDMRAVSAVAKSWDFTVTSTVADEPISLTWPAIATVPGKQDLVLTDLDSNVKVNLRTRANYTIAAGHTGVTRHLRVEVKPASRVPLDLVNLNAHINPSRAAGEPASVSISYMVTTDATVQINILKNGRPVRIVDQGRSRSAGTDEVLWDTKNSQGVKVPADAYTIEVRAEDADGHLVRKVTPLLLTGRQ
ncbi:MAG TPA: carboxypeptidase regulatory-like domain-containing protein [Chthonomonadaceae bacterium]|nr:carboxypeptidase regulatory-like domain-containing protein [Chthonomonadaceae bacterium]